MKKAIILITLFCGCHYFASLSWAGQIFTHAHGVKCGLEWSASFGGRAGVAESERVAKWDCSGAADPVIFKKIGSGRYKIFSIADGVRCGFEWAAAKGPSSGVNKNERVAKWDCEGNADIVFINKSGGKYIITTTIDGKKCGLQWNNSYGGGVGVSNQTERVAKWDCSNQAPDPMTINW